MTNLKTLLCDIPDYANVISQNIENLLSDKNTTLTQKQIFGAALGATYTTREKRLINNIENEAKYHLNKKEILAVKSTTSLMAMAIKYNNFSDIANGEKSFEKLDETLQAIAKSYDCKAIDLEICALAISVASGCDVCIENYTAKLKKSGLDKEQIDVTAKISATITGAAQVLRIEETVE